MQTRKLWLGLLLIIFFLESAYVLAFKTQTFLPLFDLDGESNLPTWTTSSLLAIAGFLAYLNHLDGDQKGRFWFILSICCTFISLDEIAQIHEQLSIITGIKWVFIYAPIGGIVMAYLYWQSSQYWNQSPHLKMIMQGVFLGFILATGLEFLSYMGLASPWQKLEYMAEEGAEMLGAGMILIGCVQEFHSKFKSTNR